MELSINKNRVTEMKIKLLVLSSVLSVFLLASIAQAAETDIFVVSGTYGDTGYVYTPGYGSAAATVAINGAGAGATATLMAWSYSPDGYKYWRGNIPVESVTSTGIDGISVSINTCEISNTGGCGQVDFSVRADVPASGWTDNGVFSYTGNGYVSRQVGERTVRFASSTGYVNGIPVDSSRAFMVKGDEVSISVTVGE